jgi:hypothetical protein
VITPDLPLLKLSVRTCRAVLVGGALLVCWAPVAGQQPALDTVPPGLQPAGMALDSATLGARRGLEAARYESTQGWIWGGFAGGLTLGPIGAGLAWTLANNSDVALGVERRMLLHYDGGSTYIEAFERAYAGSLLARRKQSALRGGILGTAGLVATATVVWAIYYYY